MDLPSTPGGFKTIVADPPWHFKVRSEAGEGRSPQYKIMSIWDIADMPVAARAADDAHLWLWATGPILPQAFGIMDAWGFRYSGMGFVWIKLNPSYPGAALQILRVAQSDLFTGLGFTTRKNAEYCLLGRRGSPRRVAKDVHEVIISPVREHSRKPDEAYERMERYAEGPYLELFGRQSRPNWTVWGNEATKFDPPA